MELEGQKIKNPQLEVKKVKKSYNTVQDQKLEPIVLDPNEIFKKQIEVAKSQKFIQDVISGQGKRKQNIRKTFDPTKFVIQSISFPTLLPKTYRKKYRIQIRYRLKGQNRIKNKQVLFGLKDVPDYIDDHDQRKKLIRIATLKKVSDVFSPHHWRLMMLNRKPTIQQAFLKYVQQLKLTSKQN